MSRFGERLKALRGAKTKSDFARGLGLTPQTYQRYENGRIPDLPILDKIAGDYGVSFDWLFGRTNERTAMVVKESSEVYGSKPPVEVEGASDQDLLESLLELVGQVKSARGVTKKILLRSIREIVTTMERRG